MTSLAFRLAGIRSAGTYKGERVVVMHRLAAPPVPYTKR
jgi:hypothetical protein